MDTQKLFTRIAVKSVDSSSRQITGYAAAFSNIDRTGDIIEPKAFDRSIKENQDVAVFIGHDTSKLQVGEATSMQADGNGLLTITSVYNTADGDALLEVAKRRLAKGRTLGMSIGYRVHAGGSQMEKGIRHLTDLDLVEYSFLASPDFAANPLATVTGMKARQKAAGLGQVITTDDSYEDLIDDLEDAAEELLGVYSVCVCATFSDHVIVTTYSGMSDDMAYYDIPYTLDANNEPVLGTPSPVDPAFVPADAKARASARHIEHKEQPMPPVTTPVPAWDAAFVAALPDTSFAYIEGDGTAVKDDTGRTVPRTARHYPHHNTDGSIHEAQLAHALSHAATPDNEIGAKALTHLERHAYGEIHGLDPHSPDFAEGAPATLMSVGYKLSQVIKDMAEDRRAMERVGLDTKKGARLNSSMRTRLKDLHTSLGQILEWAESIEKGDDGKMRVDMFRHKLAMLELETVS